MIHIPKKADVFRLKVTKQKLEQEQERIDNFAYDIISSQIEEDTLKKKKSSSSSIIRNTSYT